MKLFFLIIALSFMGFLYAPPRVNPHVVIAQRRFIERFQQVTPQVEEQPLRTERTVEDFEVRVEQAYYRRYGDGQQGSLGTRVHETLSELCRSNQCLEPVAQYGCLGCCSGLWLLLLILS